MKVVQFFRSTIVSFAGCSVTMTESLVAFNTSYCIPRITNDVSPFVDQVLETITFPSY